MRRSVPLLIVASLLVASNALADGAYCGDQLVHSGDTSSEVRRACGPPQRTGSHEIYRPEDATPVGRMHARRIVVEEWYYSDLGPQTLPHVFFFEAGVLTEVHVGTSVEP